MYESAQRSHLFLFFHTHAHSTFAVIHNDWSLAMLADRYECTRHPITPPSAPSRTRHRTERRGFGWKKKNRERERERDLPNHTCRTSFTKLSWVNSFAPACAPAAKSTTQSAITAIIFFTIAIFFLFTYVYVYIYILLTLGGCVCCSLSLVPNRIFRKRSTSNGITDALIRVRENGGRTGMCVFCRVRAVCICMCVCVWKSWRNYICVCVCVYVCV